MCKLCMATQINLYVAAYIKVCKRFSQRAHVRHNWYHTRFDDRFHLGKTPALIIHCEF